MNKVIIQGTVSDIIDIKQCIYKVTTESLTGTMIYKVISTKPLRKDDNVIVVGELIHNINYLGIHEANGLVRDIRELVLEADIVEIKSFGQYDYSEYSDKVDLENAFDNHISYNNSIKW